MPKRIRRETMKGAFMAMLIVAGAAAAVVCVVWFFRLLEWVQGAESN